MTVNTPKRGDRVRGARESANAQFRLLRLCRVVLNLLPPEPSAERVELRTLMGELQAELKRAPVFGATSTENDMHWEVEDDAEIPTEP